MGADKFLANRSLLLWISAHTPASGPCQGHDSLQIGNHIFCSSTQVPISTRCLTHKTGQVCAQYSQVCVAAQAFRHLYSYGIDEEKLKVLAEISDIMKSKEMPSYPSE